MVVHGTKNTSILALHMIWMCRSTRDHDQTMIKTINTQQRSRWQHRILNHQCAHNYFNRTSARILFIDHACYHVQVSQWRKRNNEFRGGGHGWISIMVQPRRHHECETFDFISGSQSQLSKSCLCGVDCHGDVHCGNFLCSVVREDANNSKDVDRRGWQCW